MNLTLRVLTVLLSGLLVSCDSSTPSSTEETTPTPTPQEAHFVFAKILDPIGPLQRGEKYADPLQSALQAKGLGEVTGGGTMQAKDGSIKWIGLDIDLVDLKIGVPFVKSKLVELGAPPGSTLEYTEGKSTVEVPLH